MSDKMRHTVLLLPFAFLLHRSFAQRTITIENHCSYTVFPAVSAFPGNEESFTGVTGWESPPGPGKKEEITVPSKWQGRIWGRRGCMTNSEGVLVCVAGGCPGGLECGESVLGESTALELRLRSSTNGQYDAYDLQNGGGWSVPIRVKPEGKTCTTIECIPDLEGCPKEEMKLKDSYGVTLGCSSACFAGIEDPNVQCCMGEFANPETCTPDKIFAYEYFKTCKNSYAYFQDRTTTTVDMLCPSENEPGYTLTFCPGEDGGGKGSSNNTDTSSCASKRLHTFRLRAARETDSLLNSRRSEPATQTKQPDGQPTGTVQPKPTEIPALSSPASVIASESASENSIHSSEGGGSDPTASSGTSASPSTRSTGFLSTAISDEEGASSTSTASSDGEILGLKTPVFAAVVGGVGVTIILAVVGVCFCLRRGKNRNGNGAGEAQTATRGGPSSTTNIANAGNPAQSYALAKGRRRHRRHASSSGRRALLDEKESSEDSFFSSEEDDSPPPVARRSRSVAGNRSRG
ncbi:uncharacterized protein JCM6883_004070 [Sporobolomyces salmoneus]|uniref:uncharacterized protein n=1 Tax=Sporobolomyces salmoneus TaxID=183962 RepID=UPI00316F002D